MMILSFGPKLTNQPWYMLEVSNECTIEVTLSRIAKAIPGLFRRECIEVFVPIQRRDLDVFELRTGPYLFARSSSFACLLKLKSVPGVVGLVTTGESGRPSDAIPAEDGYVQGLIIEAKREVKRRSQGIRCGSFVRLLSGETRGFCGMVESLELDKNLAQVRIRLASTVILVWTSLANLLHLPRVPKANQLFYYCPMLGEAS